MGDTEPAAAKDAKMTEEAEESDMREADGADLVYGGEEMQPMSILNSGAANLPATPTQVDVENAISAHASSPAATPPTTTDKEDYGIAEEEDDDKEDDDDNEIDDNEEDEDGEEDDGDEDEEGGVGMQQYPRGEIRYLRFPPHSARYYATLNSVSAGHDDFGSEDDEEITLGSSDSYSSPSPSPTPSQDSTARIVVAPATVGPLQICEHTSWCHCPRDEATDPDNLFLHLSEYALARMDWRTLADRTTQHIPLAGDEWANSLAEKRVNEAQRSSDMVRTKLPVIGFNSSEDLKEIARALVAEINHHFPPGFMTLDTYHAPMIVHVREAIVQWFRDMDYDALERKFAELVEDKKDLMHLFQKFLPPRMKTISLAESGLEEKNEAEKAMQAMIDELDKAHKVMSN